MSGRSDEVTSDEVSAGAPSELTRRARASRNADELRDIWAEAVTTKDFVARRAVASNTFSDTELLDEIVDDPNVVVVHDAVRNLNLGRATLDRVLGINGSLPDRDIRKSRRWIEVLVAAAWSPALSPKGRRRLGKQSEPEVRTAIAFRTDLSDAELESLLTDDDIDIAAAAAYMLQRDPERFPALLADLRMDEDVDVALAASGQLPARFHEHLERQQHLIKGIILKRPMAARLKTLDLGERRFRDRSAEARKIGNTRWAQELAGLVEAALTTNDLEILRTAAGNRNCGAETLDVLADVDDIYTVLNVVRNQRTTGDTIDRIFALAPGTDVPSRYLDFLDAAGNDAGLQSLVRITWRHVEIAAARHLRLNPPLRRQLGREHYTHDARVVRELAARTDLSDWELEEYGTHHAASVTQHVAKTLHDDPERSPWLLNELLSDPHPFVRGYARGMTRAEILEDLGDEAIAETKVLPPELQHLANDGGPDFS